MIDADDPRVDAQLLLEDRVANVLREAGVPPDLNTCAALLMVAERLKRALGVDSADWRRMLDAVADHEPESDARGEV